MWCESVATCRPAVGVSVRCRGPSHFSLRAQRKVTKRKSTPVRRSPGIGQLPPALPQLRHPCRRLPCESVSLGRAFRRGSCPDEKFPASLPGTLRAFPSEPHRRTGAPDMQRASCAHFPEKPQQQQRQEQKPVLMPSETGLASRTFRPGMGGKRQTGWPSLLLRASCPPPSGPASPFAVWVTFLLATQEKSESSPVGGSKRFSSTTGQAIASKRHGATLR